VASYNSPGGNATGVHIFSTNLDVKRLGLLHDLMPNAKLLGVLINPRFPYAQDQLAQLEAAANTAGLRLQIYKAAGQSKTIRRLCPAAQSG
jgi:putative ABC transport system substrate-binding protein